MAKNSNLNSIRPQAEHAQTPIPTVYHIYASLVFSTESKKRHTKTVKDWVRLRTAKGVVFEGNSKPMTHCKNTPRPAS